MQGTRKVLNRWLILSLALGFPGVALPTHAQGLVQGVWSGMLTLPDGQTERMGIDVVNTGGQLGIRMVDLRTGQSLPATEVRVEDARLAFSIEGADPVTCSLQSREDGGYVGECTFENGLSMGITMVPPGVGGPIQLPAEGAAAEPVGEARPADEAGTIADEAGRAVAAAADPAATIAPISVLGDLLQRNLDTALERQVAASRQAAMEWQADARLHEVSLVIDDDSGAVGWRFTWFSDDSGRYLQMFSRARSMHVGGEDPDVASKATLDPGAMAGFDRAVQALDESGIDLAGISPADVLSFELSCQDWRDPAGYYYYLFLRSGAQHWIVAETGEIRD